MAPELTIKRAVRSETKLRLALVGPSGSGKTYSALRIAFNLVGKDAKVIVIDSERGSATDFDGESPDGYPWVYDILELPSFEMKTYMQALDVAEAEGYDVIIIDSLTHAWKGTGGMLDLVHNIATRRGYGTDFPAWKEADPFELAFWDRILQVKCHLIATMRAKTEYVVEQQERHGKTVHVPRRVGLKPIQREEKEYEFTIYAHLDQDHNMVIVKTRCTPIDGMVFQKPGAEFATIVGNWLNSAEAQEEAHWTDDDITFKKFLGWLTDIGLTLDEAYIAIGINEPKEFPDKAATMRKVNLYIEEKSKERKESKNV